MRVDSSTAVPFEPVSSRSRRPLGYDSRAKPRPGGDAWMAVPAFDGRRFHPSPAGSTEVQPERKRMSVVSMRELLEAGVHFGHQTRRWNPKMRRFIFTERGGIYIIDLEQTLELVEEAHNFARNLAERNGSILFVGTKKQAQTAVEEQAKRVGMPYVNHRWLGGLLTNWRTISSRIDRLHELRRLKEEGQLDLLPAKERLGMEAELEKLDENLGGVAEMKRQPDAVFIIDLRKEQLAVREARRLGLPIIALVDTNSDPDEADYVIPGNDDAIRACDLIVRVIADGLAAGQQKVTPTDFTSREPEREKSTIQEGDYEQVSPGEEPVAEQPQPEEVRVDG
jgi:small subunit ribosomal protein S2